MATRNVVLTEHQDALVDRLVSTGRYQNASEALREGLRLLEERESALDHLKLRLDAAVAEADRGHIAGEADAVISEIMAGIRSGPDRRQTGE